MAGKVVPKFDSGYGWLVTFACFSSCFIMQGLTRAAGVMYVAIIETYGVSREVATTPFSLRYGVRNMVGPIVGIVAQRFGIRSAVVIGAILSSVGAALCSIAPNVLWITILWGVVHGIGYGLCCTIHILILNQYFDKYKATSIALALTGDCFGTFVFPTLLEYLLLNYGVDGTFLILGAIALNIVPAGLLMRAPDWAGYLKKEKEKNAIAVMSNDSYINGTENKAFEDCEVYISNLNSKHIEKVAAPKGKHNSLTSNLKISSVKGNYFNNVLNNCDFKNLSLLDADKQNEVPQDIHSSECNRAKSEHFKEGQNAFTRRRLESIFPPSSETENKYLSLLEKESVESQKSSQGKEILSDQIESSENSVCNFLQTKEDIEKPENYANVLTSKTEIEQNGIVPQNLEPVDLELENQLASDEPSAPIKRKDSMLDKILSLPTAVISEMKDYKPLQEPEVDQNRKTMAPDNSKLNVSSVLTGNLTFPMRKHSLNTFNCPLAKCNRMLDNNTKVTLIEESQFPEDAVVCVKQEDSQVGVKSNKTPNALKQFLNLNIRPLMLLIGINLAGYSIVLIAVFTIIADYVSDKGMETDVSKYLVISFSVADLFGRIGFGLILDKKWIKLSLYSGVNMAVMGLSVLALPLSSNYWYMMSCMALFGLMQGGNAIVYPLLVEEYMNEGEENVALGCLVLYGGLVMFPLAPMIGFFRDTIGNYDGVFYTVGGICLLAGILWILEPLMLNLQRRMSKKAVK